MHTAEKNSLRPVIAGNTDTGMLKILALIFMIVDHLGSAFFPGIFELRIIGRIAFPLYVWCCVVGMTYTKDPIGYMLRVLVSAFISQPCFMLGLNHTILELNVMFTLFLGLFALWGIREKRMMSQFITPVIALFLACVFKMDYGWKGIMLMLCLYAARERRGAIAAVFVCFCLFWGAESSVVYDFFGLALPNQLPNWMGYGGALLRAVKKLQFMAVLALPFMLMKRKHRINLPRWFSYGAYPAHLLIIGIIRNFLIG